MSWSVSGDAIDEVSPVKLPLLGNGRAAEPIRLAVLLPDDAHRNRDRGLRERDAERWLRQRAGISLREEAQPAVTHVQDADERIVDAGAQLAARTAAGPPSREWKLSPFWVTGRRRSTTASNCDGFTGLSRKSAPSSRASASRPRSA